MYQTKASALGKVMAKIANLVMAENFAKDKVNKEKAERPFLFGPTMERKL
jgi:hypothetical protein